MFRRTGRLATDTAGILARSGLRRLRLRGLTSAGDAFLLAATAQNLRRLARNLAASAPPGAMAPA